MGRSKFVKAAKPQNYSEFVNRVQKTFYYGTTRESEMHISHPLANYASNLFSEPHKGHSLNHLHTITVGRTQATPCSLIMALIYLDRLNVLAPEFVRRIAPNDLFVVALIISIKFNGCIDEEINVKQFAKDVNTTVDRINELEWEFVDAIDWKVYISKQEFYEKLYNVERILAMREGCRRGSFTYTELLEILPSFAFVKFILSSTTIFALTYAASVMAIAGAFMLASRIPGTIWYRKPMQENTVENLKMPATDFMQDASDLTVGTLEPYRNYAEDQLNKTCNGLDIEAELLKLEKQYCEEARNADKRKLERHPYNAKPLFNFLTNLNHQHGNTIFNKPNIWLLLKSEYSDTNEIMLGNIQSVQFDSKYDSAVWKFMYIMMQQTYALVLPLVKFI